MEGKHSEVSLVGRESLKSTKSFAARYDGHLDGHLNCVALRHGWRRSFSVPATGPKSVENLDYATFQAILELSALRLRPLAVRIYIEHPPESGNYAKVRPWKDDGSLQSVLTKRFFAERMEAGVVCVLEVRDGADREDAMSVKSLAIGGGNKIVSGGRQTKEWLKTHVPRRRKDGADDDEHDDEDEDGAAPPVPPKKSPSRFGALMYAIGLTSTAPAPPTRTAEDLQEELKAEEQELRKRGWLPPVIRRVAARRSQSQKSTRTSSIRSSPFFGKSERDALFFRHRNNSREQAKRERYDDGPPAHLGSEYDPEELGVIDDEDLEGAEEYDGYEPRVTEWTSAPPADRVSENGNEADDEPPAGGKTKPAGNSRGWLRMFGSGNSNSVPPSPNAEGENPFDDGQELRAVPSNGSKKGAKVKGKKKDKKDKGKGKATNTEFTGAQVVRHPSDAFSRKPTEDPEPE